MTTGEASAEAEMEPDCSRCAVVPSFEFAFNSPNFSDRVLRLEIVAVSDVGGRSAASCVRHREEKVEFSSMMVAVPVLREKTIYINSAILAARSPFFLKLFSNGMKESDQKDSTIRIADAEENALMELLSFMYSGKLTTTEPTLLLDIFTAAAKFEVLSCMRHCSQLLRSLPMTTESALIYLKHRCSISVTAEVQPLIDAAKEFLINKHKDLAKIPDELMHMPLAGIEAIFSSTDIHVYSEDEVYTFLLKWAKEHYPESEERNKIWSSQLLPLVRFCHMTWGKLRRILTCSDDDGSDDDDIDHDQTTKRITDVLLHKAYPAHQEGDLFADPATCWQVPQRSYEWKPVKVVEFDRPCQQVILFLDLTREECCRIYPTEVVVSHLFHLAGQNFALFLNSVWDGKSKSSSFGLRFRTLEQTEDALCLDFEFAARKRPSLEFVRMLKENVICNVDCLQGCSNLFGVEWSKFIADDDLFIDGVLHLRADFRVVVGQPI